MTFAQNQAIISPAIPLILTQSLLADQVAKMLLASPLGVALAVDDALGGEDGEAEPGPVGHHEHRVLVEAGVVRTGADVELRNTMEKAVLQNFHV